MLGLDLCQSVVNGQVIDLYVSNYESIIKLFSIEAPNQVGGKERVASGGDFYRICYYGLFERAFRKPGSYLARS